MVHLKRVLLILLAFAACLDGSACAVSLAGDLDGNFKVDLQDLLMFSDQWLASTASIANLDGVGMVDQGDFAILAGSWGQSRIPLFINEFMAQNYTAFPDSQGQYDDWIEIYNAGQADIDLAGMYLTDDLDIPAKWRIPSGSPGETTITAGGFLLIWADMDTSDGPLHVAFQLDAGGEEIALFDTDGNLLIDSIIFGKQTADISLGREPDAGDNWVTLSPTPGASNDDSYLGLVADTKFSVNRGFYDSAFEVTITCNTLGAVIHYTLDGTEPQESVGGNTLPYSGPVTISTTTCLRAAASNAGWHSSNIDTQTYIFLDDVINQPANPAGFPSEWGSYTADYEMDPDVVNDPVYGPQLETALLSLPTICITTDQDNLFDSGIGIYTNSLMDGVDWERPASMEYFTPDGTKQYQIDCGLRIQGGYFRRNSATRKHSFRLLFKGIYGATKMEFPIFESEEDAVASFDTLVLRAGANDGYSWKDMGTAVQYTRDQFGRSLQRDTGHAASHGMFVHLYVNGLYWGLYNPVERPDGAFSASYYGGDKEDWDVFKHNKPDGFELNQGDRTALNQMLALCSSAAGSNSDYQKLQGNNPDGSDNLVYPDLLDVDNYIDYMIVNMWAGNHDWPWNNYWLARKRTADSTGFKFYCWDIEDTLDGPRSLLDKDKITSPDSRQVGQPHHYLRQNAEYKILFADHLHKYFFNGGILEPDSLIQRYSNLADWIELSIIAESARWGDQHYSTPLGHSEWIDRRNRILNTYLPQRSDIVMAQFRSADLYPAVDAPVFNINGSYQHGGYVDTNDLLTMTNPGGAGTMCYTLDGSDPRLPGGAVNPNAATFEPGGATTETVARVAMGSSWNYLYDGSDQGTAWQQLSFPDGSWGSGNGELGFGDGDENKDIGPQVADQMSAYFRHTFTVSDTADMTELTINLKYDDGAVIYINEQEVGRANMPTGTIDYDTAANDAAENWTVTIAGISPTVLNVGQNILAVEIHQNQKNSSDLSFDLELDATVTISGGDPPQESLTQSTQVKARVLDSGTWSALNEAIYAVGPVKENLRITELMYHPAAADPNTEYIELKNIGDELINLNLVSFTNGIDFIFGDTVLDPNEYLVVVQNQAAFEAKYGTDPNIAGQYVGSLDNGGEEIDLDDALSAEIHDFDYKDGWYDITDGGGFSLTIKDPAATDPNLWDEKAGWRPSAAVGGSPGIDDSSLLPPLGAIVINEVLAHSHAAEPDWIELHNTTASAIDIGGWFLSDNNNDDPNIMKYEIPSPTTIAAGGYAVYYQDTSFGDLANPGCTVPFALSEGGETAYLHSGVSGTVTGYVEEESFGASERNVAFGRYYKASTDSYNFVAMSANTPGAVNAYPKVGPIVISEIHYHPETQTGDTYDNDEYEFVELLNISGSPVTLQNYDALLGINVPWKFTNGIDYTFPLGTTIAAGQRLVIARNLAAYAERYGSSAGILGPFANDTKLSNGGEKLDLSMPGDQEAGVRYYIRMDRVNYSDGSHPVGDDPWPVSADGLGDALDRIDDELYGNDIANWQAMPPSPAQ